MDQMNTVVAVYPNHADAEQAVKELQKSGFDLKQLSIIGKDYHTEENIVGYYNGGDRMKYWSVRRARGAERCGTATRAENCISSGFPSALV